MAIKLPEVKPKETPGRKRRMLMYKQMHTLNSQGMSQKAIGDKLGYTQVAVFHGIQRYRHAKAKGWL